MKKVCGWMVLILVFLFPMIGSAQFDDPFKVSAEIRDGSVFVEVGVPDKHYLYADHFKVTDASGSELKAISLPAPVSIEDPNTGKPKPVYDKPFKAEFEWKGGAAQVSYWGCNDQVCFIPQTKNVAAPVGGTKVPAYAEAAAGRPDIGKENPAVGKAAAETSNDWKTELTAFEIGKTAAGFRDADGFLAFLGAPAGSASVSEDVSGFKLFLENPEEFVKKSGLLLTLLFILIGGLALNLTPCVLPMIPINLAIIGAGAQAGSKGRGFALGATYGFGIALVYGLLGLVVALTGSRFGALQSSPWFNLAIAAIFLMLALAMFDLFHIDFSRFQSKMGSGGAQKQGSFVLALTMGSVAALLAGACVAPVVIAVLLLATSMGTVGLILPFLLGLGMALPWPFAGAGLSFLPKPGKWMEYVKYGFGVLIILFALYYGKLSYEGFSAKSPNKQFAIDLKQAAAAGRPVVIDFWATWCKNCKAMEKTTFTDEAVQARMEGYTLIKYQAEDPNDPDTKAVMDHFAVQGLPTFVLLDPKN